MPSLPASTRNQIPEAVALKVETMDPINQAAFVDEFRRKRKSVGVAYVIWALSGYVGFHYLYFKKPLLFLIFILTMGGFLIWWLVDIFRVPGMVREHNKSAALGVLRDIQILA